MKVKELIEQLQKVSQEAEIEICDFEGYYNSLKEVKIREESPEDVVIDLY